METLTSPDRRARLTTALAAVVTATCVVAAGVVLLFDDPSSAASHTAGSPAHGGSMEPGSAMYGEHVAAPGGPDATDYMLDLPPAKPYSPGRVREFTLVTEEHDIEIAEGLEFPAWTFTEPGKDPAVPGPTMRVTEGDRVRITLKNHSSQPHSLHTHGIHPADQDGVIDMVQPGEEFTYEFTAGPSGVQPYHCHAMPLKKHINKGLYGMIIIDPKQAPPAPADREMAMVMNSFDTNHDGENEVYAVNGLAFHYSKYPIRVKRGELNRIYVANMTENDPLNSFHVHGNFFDYYPIGFDNPKQYTDLVTQIQGDRGIIDLRFPETGMYMFHAHQTEFGDLGWMGFFEVVA